MLGVAEGIRHFWQVETKSDSLKSFAKLVHDRMTASRFFLVAREWQLGGREWFSRPSGCFYHRGP